MKETGTDHWESESSGTSNSSGFTALPAGLRTYTNGSYSLITSATYFWTSTSGSYGRFRSLYANNSTSFGSSTTYKTYGLSIRCLED